MILLPDHFRWSADKIINGIDAINLVFECGYGFVCAFEVIFGTNWIPRTTVTGRDGATFVVARFFLCGGNIFEQACFIN